MKKEELKEKVKSYKFDYNKLPLSKRIINILIKHVDYYFYKVLVYSQKYRYCKERYKSKKSILNLLKFIYYGKKYFKYSKLSGCEIYSELGKNIKIFHRGIVINDNAIIGDGVKFHGNNCIGNNGKNNKAPTVGKNVDVGVGSVLIGDITIANEIIIGANTMVNKSFLEKRNNNSWKSCT